jgi:DNA polymerase III subunit gamma/tau
MSESYKVLTRKYRPRSFDDVVSQEHVINTLRNAIEQGRISHAYLFCGPRGVGKTTMARVVARMINGVGMDVDGEELGRTLDIIEIDAASNSGVDDVRQLRDGVRVPPQNGTYKVYIIDEVHMLSKAAFNALLKTLEEPPSYVKFIFATTEPHKVLPTVLSRCQRFDFRRIKVGEIVDRLRYICEQEAITVDDTSLHVIARKADGALRDALSIMDQAIAYCGQTITRQGLLEALNVVGSERLFEIIGCAARRDTTRAMQIVDELLLEGHDIQEFLIALTEHLRNLYLARDAASAGLIEATDEELGQMRKAASDFSEQDLLRMLHLVNEAQFKVREAQQPRIQLEITVLRLVTMDRSESLNELLSEIRDLKKKLYEPGLSADKGGRVGDSGPETSGKIIKAHAPGAINGRSEGDAAGSSTGKSVGKAGSKDVDSVGTAGSSTRKSVGKAGSKDVDSIGTAGSSTGKSVGKAGSKDVDSVGTAGSSSAFSQETTSETASNADPSPKTNGSITASPTGKGTLLDAFLGTSAIKKKKSAEPTPQHRNELPNAKSSEKVPSNGIVQTGNQDPNPGATSNGQLYTTSDESSAGDGDGEDSGWVEEDGEIANDSTRSITFEELQVAWPAWLEQVRKDCQQLVYFTLSKTRLAGMKDGAAVVECQDELVRQMIRQHEGALIEALREVVNVSVPLKTLVRYTETEEEDNDPYAQFKKARASDPKVDMIVNILGAELEY